MHRFQAIEGARGWLAWMVVISHVSQILGLDTFGGHWIWPSRLGDTGVTTFIVISGFVITNLIMDKHEPYPRYLLRRGFRIFPAYWLAYGFAIAVLPFAVQGAALLPLAHDPRNFWLPLVTHWQETLTTHPWLMVLSHLALLQGVIADSFIPFAGTDVLGPAWSLTLEWQFYLVAPAMIWAFASKAWRLLAVCLIALGVVLMRANVIGEYNLPNFLPASAHLFMIGIGCRLAFDELKKVTLGPETLIVVALLGVLFPDLLWLAVWSAIYIYILNAEKWRTHPISRVVHAALESAPARYFGARSYSVYLLHLPILELMAWLIATRLHPNVMPFAAILFLFSAPLILIASDLMYRLVERPFIRLGAAAATPRNTATA